MNIMIVSKKDGWRKVKYYGGPTTAGIGPKGLIVCERTFSQEKQYSQAALLSGVDWKFAALLSDWKAQAGHFYACHLALPGNSRPNHYENNTQENQKNPVYRNFKSESIQSRVSILSLVVECFIESISNHGEHPI